MAIQTQDQTLTTHIPELVEAYKESSEKLKESMHSASFDGNPLFGTVYQMGRPHPFLTSEVLVNKSFLKLRDRQKKNEDIVIRINSMECAFHSVANIHRNSSQNEVVKNKNLFNNALTEAQSLLRHSADDIEDACNSTLYQAKLCMQSRDDKPTFFAFDEAQKIGFTVLPGQGVSFVYPMLELPQSSTSDNLENWKNGEMYRTLEELDHNISLMQYVSRIALSVVKE